MKSLLSSTAFIILNKELARKIGLNEAIMLADLISKEEYFIKNGTIKDGWFFNTEANIEADTTLNSYHQRKCLKTLKKHQIIETKRKGIPAKQYFKINEFQVIQILNNLSIKIPTTINKNKEIKIINNISHRRNDFVFQVLTFDYDESILNAFIDYWTEPNKSNTKMKFELNKTWQTSLRLKTWVTNQKKWDKPKSKKTTMSKLDAQINEWNKAKELL